jgi:hypothetical protein
MRTPHPRGPLGALIALAALLMLALSVPAGALIDPGVLTTRDVAAERSAELTDGERRSLETAAARLERAGTPTKFVVLGRRPGSAADAQRYALRVRNEVGPEHTVLVLSAVPRNLAIASALTPAQTNAIFQDRVPELRADPVRGTVLVAQDIGEAIASRDAPEPVDAGTGSSGNEGGGSVWPVLLIFGAGAGGLVWLGMRGRRKARERVRDQQGLEKAMLDPLVDALAAQINDLDPEVQVGNAPAQAATADFQEAVLTYADAREAVEKAQTPAQIGEARAMLERGLRAARRARAHLDGRPVAEAEEEPLLQGLCTFDPKHGRAVGDATVTAPDGRTAEVPVCAECLDRMEHGRRPEIREVEVAGRRRPYWQSGGAGGGAAGMGGLMNGALLGILLGGMFGGGGASADDSGGGGWPDQWSGGGGDAGGGFGGGDFGGGGGGGGSGGGDF